MVMMRSAVTVVLAAAALTLAACNRVEQDRTSAMPPDADNTVALLGPKGVLSAPPAPAERGAPTYDAIAQAAGTQTGNAFADARAAQPLPPPKGGSLDNRAAEVRAQAAAAKAPDTASADAVKKKILDEPSDDAAASAK
jgi:hypothetical protein